MLLPTGRNEMAREKYSTTKLIRYNLRNDWFYTILNPNCDSYECL